MSEMSTIEQLIADELRGQAEGAVPPPDAWDRFVASIESQGAMRLGVDSVEADVDEARADDLRGDYLQLRPDGSESTSRLTGLRGTVVAVAAAVLVVVGALVVADGNGGEIETDQASTPSAADPVASPTVPVAPYTADDVAPPGGVREPESEAPAVPEVQPDFRGAGLSSVTAGGPGLVAVGSAGSGPAVWTSVDGITWSRVPHDEEIFGTSGWITDVTAGGPGLVAVGADTSDEPWSVAVWTSADGLTWSRVPHDEAVFGDAGLSSVTVGGPGLVAVGKVNYGPDELTGDDAAVWTSVDGLTWSRVPHDEAVFGGTGNMNMLDVTAGGPGLVAVGRDGQNVWDYALWQVAAVWTSVDGLTWSRVPHDEAVFGDTYGEFPSADPDSDEAWAGQAMLSVTAGGPGLVAVGWDTPSDESWRAAVWTSIDGLTWSRVPHAEEIFGTSGYWGVVGVTAGGPGLVAVGDAVWTSVDGLTWSRGPDVETGLGLGPWEEATGWGVTAGGPGLVAVGKTGSDGAVWTSVDGVTWSVVSHDEPTTEAG